MNGYDAYKGKGLSGLVNMGNTCYLNSAIQCLSHTLPLTDYFISKKYEIELEPNKGKREYQFCREYNRLILGLWDDPCVVKPIAFRAVFAAFNRKFNNNMQQDAQETLSLILDNLHNSLSYHAEISYQGAVKNPMDKLVVESIETWKNYFKKEYSKILEIFYGQFFSEVICSQCKKSSNTFDPFCTMAIPITAGCRDIHDCLIEFTKLETLELDAENKWKCEFCGQLGDVQKKISIWKLPKILIIVLKRFQYGVFSAAAKINTAIDFPLTGLNFSNYTYGYDKYGYTYDLFGIIHHVGGANGGHYFANCRNGDNWYEFNDENVSRIDRINRQTAYVLFYIRRDE